LQVLLHRLEPDVPQAAGDQIAQEGGALDADELLLAEGAEQGLREPPEQGDGGVAGRQDEEAALQQDAQVVLVGGAGEAARGEGVEGGGAAEGDEPGRRHGEHVGEGGRGQGLGREAAGDEDRGRLQRVLQRVGQDHGHRGLGEQPDLGEPAAVVGRLRLDRLGGGGVEGRRVDRRLAEKGRRLAGHDAGLLQRVGRSHPGHLGCRFPPGRRGRDEEEKSRPGPGERRSTGHANGKHDGTTTRGSRTTKTTTLAPDGRTTRQLCSDRPLRPLRQRTWGGDESSAAESRIPTAITAPRWQDRRRKRAPSPSVGHPAQRTHREIRCLDHDTGTKSLPASTRDGPSVWRTNGSGATQLMASQNP